MPETSLAVVDSDRLTPIKVEEVKEQVHLIQDLMKDVMQEGQHFGVIPGTQKPTLLKPGAEKLCFTFRLVPAFDVEEIPLEGQHREFRITCTLRKISNGIAWGQGIGSCSTMETKYRYRESKRKCPKCGQETIRKSSEEKGGGWYCWRKIGGCGLQFKAGDPSIEAQTVGRTENPDIADQYNTCIKMATKRAHVAATLYALAASDIFTQDMEDVHEESPKVESPAGSAETTTTGHSAGEQKPTVEADTGSSPVPAGDLSPEEKIFIRVQEHLDAGKITKAQLTTYLHKNFCDKKHEQPVCDDLRKLNLLQLQAVSAWLTTV